MDTVRINTETKRPPRDETPPRNRSRGSRPAQDAPSGDGDTGAGGVPRARRPSPNTKAGRLDAQIKDSLVNLYGTIGLAIGGIGQMHGNPGMVAAGVNVTVQADTTADLWIELGQQMPAVRRALESMLTGSAIATIAMAHVAMVAPVAAAFGLIPSGFAEPFLTGEAREAGAAFAQMQSHMQASAATNGSDKNS